jgi:dienelactone hydrolase
MAERLLGQGHAVVVADVFQTGELIDDPSGAVRDPFANLFTTYNRTDLQQRARDLATLCEFARREMPDREVLLCGEGRAGLWALLASPAADAVAADIDGLDTRGDASLMGADLFVPGLRKMGGFDAVAALAAPRPLLLHGAGNNFDTTLAQAAYRAAGSQARLEVKDQRSSEAQLAQWVDGLK